MYTNPTMNRKIAYTFKDKNRSKGLPWVSSLTVWQYMRSQGLRLLNPSHVAPKPLAHHRRCEFSSCGEYCRCHTNLILDILKSSHEMSHTSR